MGATKLLTAAGGGITLDAASTATDKTITIPARTGNMAVDGPAFSAYQSSAQTLSSATTTKLQFQTEEWDTNSNFDNATNYRFTPTVAGYYQTSGAFSIGVSATVSILYLYKNGSLYKILGNSNTAVASTLNGSCSVYLNGTTDYIELYGYVGTGQALSAQIYATYFQASMVRAA